MHFRKQSRLGEAAPAYAAGGRLANWILLPSGSKKAPKVTMPGRVTTSSTLMPLALSAAVVACATSTVSTASAPLVGCGPQSAFQRLMDRCVSLGLPHSHQPASSLSKATGHSNTSL